MYFFQPKKKMYVLLFSTFLFEACQTLNVGASFSRDPNFDSSRCGSLTRFVSLNIRWSFIF